MFMVIARKKKALDVCLEEPQMLTEWKLHANTCIPPWKENEPRMRVFSLEEGFPPPPFSFFGDSLDWINPEISEPNLVDNKTHVL